VRLPSYPSAAFPASLLAASLALITPAGCGTDSNRTYAGLSSARIELDEGGYVLRYLAPPWEKVNDDPLTSGRRKSSPIGGESTPILADSGVALEIERVSNSDVVNSLTFPKYRLETALVPCAQEDVGDLSCAEYLAGLDYEARQADGSFDRFGSAPRVRKNHWDQQYYELMGQIEATGRFRRVIFFEGVDAPETLAGWMLIEANPDLAEREVTELVRAFEMLPGSGAQP